MSLDAVDKALVTAAVFALVAIVHALAYTSADGALRAQRLMLRRGADLLAVAGVVFLLRLWLN